MITIAVLCGGQGRRIRPLTDKIPKPLIPVAGRPILDHILEFYKAQGVRDFIFCVGYKAEKIEEFLARKNGITKTISNEGEGASMLRRLHALRDRFEGDLFVCYGDTFSDVALPEIVESHRKSGKAMTIMTSAIQSPFGLVSFDSGGQPAAFEEKPVLNYYIGHFVMNKRALGAVTPGMLEARDGGGLVELFNDLIKRRDLNVFRHDKTLLTFNTQEEHEDVEKKLRHFYSLNEVVPDESER